MFEIAKRAGETVNVKLPNQLQFVRGVRRQATQKDVMLEAELEQFE